MANKVIIGILVFLVVISGGFGYYLYGLNQQVDSLSGQLVALQAEQASRIDAVNDELAAFRGETLTGVDNLKGEIDETLTRIAGLGDEIGRTTDRVNTLEEEMEGSIAEIGNLKNEAGETLSRIGSLENEVSPVMDASEVYQRVSQATVRISNGESTIGSGFIFDNESHVVTAHHVIENLTSIYIIFPDGRVSKATLVGSSAPSDVAVLTLQDTPIVEALTLADSDQVNVGQPAVAIGNPFDLPGTMTAGIVSQTGRFAEIESDSQVRWIANLIQFDAPANSGNSGCPLFNSAGEVIGMVIARINPSEGDGIYYAVSSNKIKRVANSIIAKGFFDYPWLGVNIADITPQIVQDMSLETTNGALVVGILSNSPAKASGIEADDIIVAIDGVMIRNIADLTSYLGEHKNPEDLATLELIRGATKMELTTEIGSRPS